MRQLLLLSLPPAAEDASWLAVVVDQLELAAAAGGADGGLLGGGDAAAVAAAGAGAGAAGGGAPGEESVREPNHRVRRLPPLLLFCCFSLATEVLQAPGALAAGLFVGAEACGDALAVRVGGGSGCGAASLVLPRPKLGSQLLRGGDEVLG